MLKPTTVIVHVHVHIIVINVSRQLHWFIEFVAIPDEAADVRNA